MFSPFQCCSLTSETFQQGGTWQNLQVRAHKRQSRSWQTGGPAAASAPLHAGQAAPGLASSFLGSSCPSRGLPSHSTGLPPPELVTHTHLGELQESWGWGLGKERENTFSSLSANLTRFQCEAQKLRSPSSCLPSRCVFWMAYQGVCCVNVRGNVRRLWHPGAVSNSLPSPPVSSTLAHSGSRRCSESWPGPQFPAALLSLG